MERGRSEFKKAQLSDREFEGEKVGWQMPRVTLSEGLIGLIVKLNL